MLTISSQHLQTKFGEVSDIVKSREPVVITQYNRPTLVLTRYEDAMTTMCLAAKMRFIERLNKNARYTTEPTDDELAELSRLIDEERESIYQEDLKKNEK